jgi:uncharacterized protein (TIGR03067 family)
LPAPEARRLSDREALQGTWVAVSVERDGERRPDDEARGQELLFDGDRLTYRTKKGDKGASYRLDATRKPKEIDVAFDEGTRMRAIYELDGTRLRLCWTKGGEVRPAGFDTSKEPFFTFLFTYEKKP